MGQALLAIRDVALVSALDLFRRGQVHTLAIDEAEAVHVGVVRQAVLPNDHVPFTLTGLVQHFRDSTAGIGPADVHHAGLQRFENGIPVVKVFLRRPQMSLLKGVKSRKHGRPELIQLVWVRLNSAFDHHLPE